MTFHLTSPHPQPTPKYSHTGRGGAGNQVPTGALHRAPSPSSDKPLPPSNARFASGRGGAGNVHEASERAIFQFDEELAQQRTRDKHVAPVVHIGRGGAGNTISNPQGTSTHRKSEESERHSRGRRSEDSGVLHRLSQTLSRGS